MNSNVGVSGNGGVNAAFSLDEREPGVGNSSLEMKTTKEVATMLFWIENAFFSFLFFFIHEWVESFREYAGTFGFIIIIDGEVPFDISNHNPSITDAERQWFCDRDLEDTKTVQWALRATSLYRTYLRHSRSGRS